jgi:hypothetical protein
VRRLTRDVPRWLAGAVRRCLRPKARRRTATARELRQSLERRLGNPSPADCRAAIACWLWDAQIFAPRKHETVVRVTPSLPRSPASLIRTAVLLGAGLVFSAVLLIYLLPPKHLRYVPAAIVDPVKSIPQLESVSLPGAAPSPEATDAPSIAAPTDALPSTGPTQ